MREWWSGAWGAIQTAEFSGAVVGSCISVLLGLIVAGIFALWRNSQNRDRVRQIAIREVQLNHARVTRLWKSMGTEKGRSEYIFVLNAEPRFGLNSRAFLLIVPDALTGDEMAELMTFQDHLETIGSLWHLYRPAYASDQHSRERSVSGGTVHEPMQISSIMGTEELKKVVDATWPSLNNAFTAAVNAPPTWAVKNI